MTIVATEKTDPGLTEHIRTEFARHFGGVATLVVRAPGRVNLIGEHTDYNDGFVLPMAIDRWTYIALRPRGDRQVQLHSLDLREMQSFSLDALEPGSMNGWVAYAHGVAGALAEAGFNLSGWEGTLASSVPIGAGLSSSASVELAVTGAGFGGCAIALVETEHAGRFVSRVGPAYESATGLLPSVYVCQPSAGAEEMERV